MADIRRDLRLFADGQELAQGCRMTLTARLGLSLRPALHQLQIRELSESSAAMLSGARQIEVRSGNSVLAFGMLSEVLTRTSGGQRITDLVFSPGLSLWQSSVSLAVPAGMKVSETIRRLLTASGSGISLAAFAAEDVFFSRPQAFFGRTCDALSLMAETVHADAFISPAGLCISGRTQREPGLVLSKGDLLTTPIRTGNRLLLVTAMTGWQIGAFARIAWEEASWTGRLVSAFLQADNVSGLWKAELEAELGF